VCVQERKFERKGILFSFQGNGEGKTVTISRIWGPEEVYYLIKIFLGFDQLWNAE
jgi:hypothetical protein